MDVVTLQSADRAAKIADRARQRAVWRNAKPLRRNVTVTHPSPPTIGAIASASAITSGRAWSPVNTSTGEIFARQRFTMLGGDGWRQRGGAFPDNAMVVPGSLSHPVQNYLYRVRFGFDGTKLEIRFGMYDQVAIPQIFVDGMQVTNVTLGTTTPHDAYLPITFADRRPRSIELRMIVPFGGVITETVDTIWKLDDAISPRCIIFGDSYTGGTGSTGAMRGYVWEFADQMGWPDTWCSGIGGSGYINPGQSVKAIDRLQNDVIQWKPDVLICTMGHNDTFYGIPALTAAVTTFWQTARAALPDTHMICTGPIVQGSNLGATYLPMTAAIQAAAAPYIDAWIETCAPWWVTGSGQDTAPNGSGSSDFYTNYDGVHFTDNGHRYWGQRLADEVTSKAL